MPAAGRSSDIAGCHIHLVVRTVGSLLVHHTAGHTEGSLLDRSSGHHSLHHIAGIGFHIHTVVQVGNSVLLVGSSPRQAGMRLHCL